MPALQPRTPEYRTCSIGGLIFRSLLLGPQVVRCHGPCGRHGSLRVPVRRQPLWNLTSISSPFD
jgi:hypothetical protein